MKNANLQYRKPAIAARVMLIILLLTSAVNLGACGWNYQEEGYYYPHDFDYYLGQNLRGDDATILKIWATSDKNIFNINDVSFNLIYGTHANKYIDRQTTNIYDLEMYLWDGTRSYDNYTFALYICDWEVEDKGTFGQNTSDIENIPDHHFVKAISSEEAFSNEYGYVVKKQVFFKNFYYKHIEEIAVPKEYIKGDRGTFVIKLVEFYKKTEENIYSKASYIVFDYVRIDDNTVKINFHES